MRAVTVPILLSVVVCVLGAAVWNPAAAQPGFVGRPITNNAFAPTGYTLHKGEFTIGIGPVHFGITENVQAGTNLLLWLFQVYNADVKVSLLKNDDRALAVGLGLHHLSLDLSDGDDDDDEIVFTSVAPYGAASFRVGSNTLLHAGGQVAFFEADDDDADIDDVDASGTATGTSVWGGVEHTYSQRTKFIADAGYDTTFEGARVGGGVLFGWDKFRLKLGLSYFTAGDGFTFPLIGLWWRFRA